MVKRKITETVEEYDKDGKLIKKTITITEEDDDTYYYPFTSPAPYNPTIQPYCVCSNCSVKN